MTALLTATQKTEIENVFDDIHDTWKRTLYAYKDVEVTILTQNANYNHVYKQAPGASVTKREVSRTIEARIYYGPSKGQISKFDNSSDVSLDIAAGDARLKLSLDDYNFVKDSKRIDLDGTLFRLGTTAQPHGFFGVKYYIITLNRIE